MTPSARPDDSAPTHLPRLTRRIDAASQQRFVEATGARIALLGDELGRFECWMWPLALVRDLELWVRGETLHRGRDLARAVAVQPDQVEIELAGPGFRILERVYAARERRAAWILFQVECERDLELQMRFTPCIEPLRPAESGGRIASRDDETGAVALGEELGRFAALLGSPEAEPPDVDPTASSEPLVVRIPCSVARARNGPLTFFIAGAERAPEPSNEAAGVRTRIDATLDAARDEYRWIVREWPFELRRLEQRRRELLDRTTHFESDDARHAEAFLWAKYGDFHGARKVLEFVTSQLLDDSPLVEGATSSPLRVCEVQHDEQRVEWTLWGLAGRTYRVGVRSDRRVRFEGALQTSEHELEITFPSAEPTEFVSLQLRAVALD